MNKKTIPLILFLMFGSNFVLKIIFPAYAESGLIENIISITLIIVGAAMLFLYFKKDTAAEK